MKLRDHFAYHTDLMTFYSRPPSAWKESQQGWIDLVASYEYLFRLPEPNLS